MYKPYKRSIIYLIFSNLILKSATKGHGIYMGQPWQNADIFSFCIDLMGLIPCASTFKIQYSCARTIHYLKKPVAPRNCNSLAFIMQAGLQVWDWMKLLSIDVDTPPLHGPEVSLDLIPDSLQAVARQWQCCHKTSLRQPAGVNGRAILQTHPAFRVIFASKWKQVVLQSLRVVFWDSYLGHKRHLRLSLLQESSPQHYTTSFNL